MNGESRDNVYFTCKEAVHGGDRAGEKVLDISHMAPKHPCGQPIDALTTRSERRGTCLGRGARQTHKHIDRYVDRF